MTSPVPCEHEAMRIACAQLTVTEDPVRNIALAADAVRRAAGEGARLVVLPEATLAPFGTDLSAAARDHATALDEHLTAVAEEHDAVVVAGSFTAAADGRVHNTVIVRGRGIRADYDKIHLYDAFGVRESDTIAPGDALCLVDVDGLRIGLATCYDVRFPEQFRALAEHGAQLIVLPAAWADGPGKAEQWRLLIRARALDATVHLAACDQAPPAVDPPPTRGLGRSAIVSPLGEVSAELGREPGLLIADISVEDVEAARTALPVLRHSVPIPTPRAGVRG